MRCGSRPIRGTGRRRPSRRTRSTGRCSPSGAESVAPSPPAACTTQRAHHAGALGRTTEVALPPDELLATIAPQKIHRHRGLLLPTDVSFDVKILEMEL